MLNGAHLFARSLLSTLSKGCPIISCVLLMKYAGVRSQESVLDAHLVFFFLSLCFPILSFSFLLSSSQVKDQIDKIMTL